MIAFFSSIFSAILSFLLLYKYLGLFLIALVSSIALPIPASASLAAAGGFASQGYLNIYAVLVVTLLGSIGGDMIGFWLARTYGERVLSKVIIFKHLMRTRAYKRFEEYIADYAPSLIFFSRFLTELSPATNLLAGLSTVSYQTFFVYALLGETGYTLLYGLAGFLLGSQWQNNFFFIVKAGSIMLLIAILVNLVHVFLYKRRTRKKTNQS